MADELYPISFMVFRTTWGISTQADVVISPAIMAIPVVTRVSQATLATGS